MNKCCAKIIYVVDSDGKPLMPTHRLGMVYHWLKRGDAHWFGNSRTTIQFDRPTQNYVQDLTLGVDIGQHLGLAVVNNNTNECVYRGQSERPFVAEVKRNNLRRMYRRTRRSRLRHRQARFNNRRLSDQWLAPSVRHQLDFNVREITRITKFLPISKVILEVQPFDIRKLTDYGVRPNDYTIGKQSGFANIKNYLYARQNGIDPLDGKHYPLSKMVVHHLNYRSHGGTNNPNNLVLITREHHNNANHCNGTLTTLANNLQLAIDTRGAYLSNIMGIRLPGLLKQANLPVLLTAGYLTAHKRKLYSIAKSHVNDALVIANGNNYTKCLTPIVKRIKKRRNNRSLAKFYDAKYIDMRDGQEKSGQELSSGRTSRSRELDYHNQRMFRQCYARTKTGRLKKGRFSIRKQHYQERPGDLALYKQQVWTVRGVHGKGKTILLDRQSMRKDVDIKKTQIIYHTNGILTMFLN